MFLFRIKFLFLADKIITRQTRCVKGTCEIGSGLEGHRKDGRGEEI